MLNKYDIEKAVEIRYCIDLMEEYNKKVKKDYFSIEKWKEHLETLSLEEIQKRVDKMNELLGLLDANEAAQQLINEIKIHGVEWVKNKYLRGVENEEV